MDEAKKTNVIRGKAFLDQYLAGSVIDIGAGKDLVCPHAECFDVQHGDANFISRFRPAESYNTVHSSHCLEHMHHPEAALQEWWSLVKPGGYMITVIPDEDLYEQGIWPSKFNGDHKATFRLNKLESWSPVSYDAREIIARLPNCQIISAEVQDVGYNHRQQMKFGDKRREKTWAIRFLQRVLRRMGVLGKHLNRWIDDILFHFGVPIDQTLREAVAQIQVVARKLPANEPQRATLPR